MSDYEVTSNRESGFSRYDILLRPKGGKGQAIMMELKRLRPKETVEKALSSALQQIEDKHYDPNSKTGLPPLIPARNSVKFKPGKQLFKFLNNQEKE